MGQTARRRALAPGRDRPPRRDAHRHRPVQRAQPRAPHLRPPAGRQRGAAEHPPPARARPLGGTTTWCACGSTWRATACAWRPWRTRPSASTLQAMLGGPEARPADRELPGHHPQRGPGRDPHPGLPLDAQLRLAHPGPEDARPGRGPRHRLRHDPRRGRAPLPRPGVQRGRAVGQLRALRQGRDPGGRGGRGQAGPAPGRPAGARPRRRRPHLQLLRGLQAGLGDRGQPRLGAWTSAWAAGPRWGATRTSCAGSATSGRRGKILYVHFRDVQGTADDFAECFLGEGNVNLTQAMRTFKEVGFTGFLIDDHVPHMVDDSEWGHRGRAYATGYMMALLSAVSQPSLTPPRSRADVRVLARRARRCIRGPPGRPSASLEGAGPW